MAATLCESNSAKSSNPKGQRRGKLDVSYPLPAPIWASEYLE